MRSFGTAVSDFSAHGEPQAFDVLRRGERVARVEWALTGVHNQLNALAAIAAARPCGRGASRGGGRAGHVPERAPAHGTARHGRAAALTVYDDFAHHPTAIRTTLDGLRRSLGRPRRASWRCSSRAATP